MYRFFIPALGLTLTVGFLTGAVVDAWIVHQASPVQVITDATPASVPTIHIDGIQNGALIGSVQGDLRLVARGHLIVPAASGSFAIADTKLLTNVIEIHVPPDMKFVASKRGKKYYPVNSASAANLSPANRIYFPDEKLAEKAGYSR